MKYKSVEVTDESQNRLSEIFGEDALTGKIGNSNGISLDKFQIETVSQSWRTEHKD